MRVQPFSYLEQLDKEIPAPPAGIVTTDLRHNYDGNNPSSYPGSGTTITDLQGNKNLVMYGTTAWGTYGGITNVFNIPNASFSYIGDNTGQTGIDITTGISMEMWVNIPAYTGADWFYSLYNVLNFGASSTRQMFRMEPSITPTNGTGGAIHYDRYVNNGNEVTPSLNFSINTWHHCIMTYEPGSFKYYLNNVDAGATTFTAPTTHFDPTDTLYLMLSRRDDRFSDNIGMITSEWRFYDKALSVAEVAQNWNATKARYGY